MSQYLPGNYDWKPGEPVPLDELRRLDRLASGFEQASVTGEGATGADGLQLVAHPPRPAFWARVASHVSGAEYTFTEVQDDGTGATSITWADVDGGLTGNAFEVNGTTDVANGTVVWVVQSEANERWEFMGPVTSGGGASLTTQSTEQSADASVGPLGPSSAATDLALTLAADQTFLVFAVCEGSAAGTTAGGNCYAALVAGTGQTVSPNAQVTVASAASGETYYGSATIVAVVTTTAEGNLGLNVLNDNGITATLYGGAGFGGTSYLLAVRIA
jgi:hypothetical protein